MKCRVYVFVSFCSGARSAPPSGFLFPKLPLVSPTTHFGRSAEPRSGLLDRLQLPIEVTDPDTAAADQGGGDDDNDDDNDADADKDDGKDDEEVKMKQNKVERQSGGQSGDRLVSCLLLFLFPSCLAFSLSLSVKIRTMCSHFGWMDACSLQLSPATTRTIRAKLGSGKWVKERLDLSTLARSVLTSLKGEVGEVSEALNMLNVREKRVEGGGGGGGGGGRSGVAPVERLALLVMSLAADG